jgi:hypothetical protein
MALSPAGSFRRFIGSGHATHTHVTGPALKSENEQRRQVRRCGFLSSFLALFRTVAVQLFGGAFAFPILSLLSFGYFLPCNGSASPV